MFDISDLEQDPRITVRNRAGVNSEGECIVYWMQRAQRSEDNPALDTAISVANLLGKPVVVFLGIVPFYPNANWRHYHFLAQGIPGLAQGLKKRNVGFVFRPFPEHSLEKFCEEVNPCLVVGDENPLRETERWRQVAAKRLKMALWTVDADVIVPSKLLLKAHFAARTIRPRIHELLGKFLHPSKEPKAAIPWKSPKGLISRDPSFDFLKDFSIDRSTAPVEDWKGGEQEAKKVLRRFLKERLDGYAELRNKPNLDMTSQLSPYLHFGHVGPRAVALAVKETSAPTKDRNAFLEELIVRRELAINFVRFTSDYDRVESAEPWAKKTLAEHAKDSRRYLYTEKQLEGSETHDPLWNAAQKQMVVGGWMHGYLRMYWAKKILEWTKTSGEAFDIAVRLNDRYELDGRDPNGYTGVAWAIAGKHDRAWGPERPVYGKIRYMSYDSTSKKFDSKAYIRNVAAL